MNFFWEELAEAHDEPALCHEELTSTISYFSLQQEIDRLLEHLPSGYGHVGLLACENSVDCIIAYLAALQAKHPVILVRADISSSALEQFISIYKPSWVLSPASLPLKNAYQTVTTSLKQMQLWQRSEADDFRAHPDLAICLSTSGSSGSPKLVRISQQALNANAQAIALYLNLQTSDRAVTSLPMSYSYGLSIINSHLSRRASLLLSERSLLERSFWDSLNRYGVSSLSGVPYSYQMMLRVGLEKLDLPHLRMLTQAGGSLDIKLMQRLHALSQERVWELFVMYGQTEATARISYVPPARLPDKWGSIGCALPGGELSLAPDTQELIYRGPNVMMGYASERLDLARGDDLNGLLYTGDLARQDEDGFFFLTGRRTRLIKMQGNRLNLDEIESAVEQSLALSAAAIGEEDSLQLFIQSQDENILPIVKQLMREQFRLHPSVVKVNLSSQLPLTANGKKDYPTLMKTSKCDD